MAHKGVMPASRPILSLRIDLPAGGRLGPGKVDLLELIGQTGSISAAARAMKMSYRRAWLLIDAANQMFRAPLVTAAPGGAHGGGARLTPLGEDVVARYRAIEARAKAVAEEHLAAILAETAPEPPEA